MANSKSNIYPIQLQGAELNLNKLDAEIKQYSGFNKNNSPFVGGCLSNVFTKEEQISGGNADNTYIDTNGDVYRVDTEGLWKNGEKLIDYTGKKFYEVKKLNFQFPANTFYVDNEYVYVSRNVNVNTFLKFDYFLNVYNIFTEEWQSIQIPIVQETNVTARVSIDTKCCKNDTTMIIALAWGSVEKTKLVVFKVNNTGISIVYDNQVIEYFTAHPIVHMEQNGDNGIISVLYSTGSRNVYIKKYNFTLSGDVEFVSETNPKNGFYVSYNRLYYFSDSGTVYDDNKRPYITKYKIVNGEIVEDNPIYIKTGNLTEASISSGVGKRVVVNKVYGYELVFGYKYNGSDHFSYLIGVCDFWTQITNGLNFAGGAVIGDYVLFNNDMPSGICLPGGNIRVSEWANLDTSHIYIEKYKEDYNGVLNFGNADVIYKTSNGEWYKLIESSPKLKRFLNQLVCNVNDVKNSFDIIKNKFVLFAPAWNNRLITPKDDEDTTKLNSDFYFYNESGIQSYMATSINEHNLDDNPSALINPVPISTPNSFPNYKNSGASANSLKEVNDILVNYYVGNENVTYKFSVILNEVKSYTEKDVYYIYDLEGLPFPSDTNGNIAYSPSLFSKFFSSFGNDVFVKEGLNVYQLSKYNNQPIMSYYLGTLVEGLQEVFILQGQYYGIINDQIFAIQFNNGVVASQISIVSVENLQFVGNTPYEALFFSKTNRCLYSFTGANVLNQKQLVDKISEVRNYLYNPATQTVFLITDIGVLFYGLFGMFLLEYTNITNIFLLDNGIVMSDNSGNYRYIKYYLDEGDEGYTKENIRLETCFYGMNNEVVTINDCLYFRLFSEEHEEGDLKVKATTISLKGRQTEETTFKIKASDWDKITHTIYLRYQPKTQRGLGVSFSIDSPFKIASMSVGSQPDAVLVDRVSKGAITAPSVTTNNNEW